MQQSKWFKSNHELGENDIVFIKDMIARIIKVDLDSMGTNRYYDFQYRVRGGGNFKVVRRAAQSLCLLLTAKEIEDNENITRDAIDFPIENPMQGSKPKQRPCVKVQIGNKAPALDDV